MSQVEIPIREEFANKDGRFRNYDCAPLSQRTQLQKQKHADLRCFVEADLTTRISMLYLNLLGMSDLDLRLMADLDGEIAVKFGEQWSQGIVEKQDDRNSWNGITLSCFVGDNVTQSVLRVA